MKKIIGAIIILLITLGAFTVWYFMDTQRQNGSTQPAPTHIDSTLSEMSLRDKVASLFMLHTPGTDPQLLQKYMADYTPGGFILMGDNIAGSDAALLAETAALRGSDPALPRLVAIDQEGGTVRRLQGDTFASATSLKDLPVAETAQAFAARSVMVQSVGVTVNFGIVADTTPNQMSFIYDRVLGTSPAAAAERVKAAVTATKGKTLSTLKHFPGHGETEADSHQSIPTTPIGRNEWLQRDAPPFIAGSDAGADMVMTGHLRYSAVDSAPASLSKTWHDILRDTIGFKGVTITDDMCMLQDSGEIAYGDPVKNAVLALQAGNTMLLYVLDNAGAANTKIDPNQLIEGVVSAVKAGKLDASVIDKNARQALELRSKSAGLAHR